MEKGQKSGKGLNGKRQHDLRRDGDSMVHRSPRGSRKPTEAWKGSGSSGALLRCSRCCEWATGPRARGSEVQAEDLGQQCLDERSLRSVSEQVEPQVLEGQLLVMQEILRGDRSKKGTGSQGDEEWSR